MGLTSMSGLLLDGGARRLDRSRPLRVLLLDEGLELVGAQGEGDERDVQQLGAGLLVAQLLDDHRVHLVDDLLRRAARREDAGPGGRLVARHGLGDRRDVGVLLHALVRRHRQDPQRPGLDLGKGDAAVEHEVQVAAEQRVARRAAAVVGDVQRLAAGLVQQHLAGEVVRGADAGRGELQVRIGLLGQLDELRQRLGLEIRPHEEEHRRLRHRGHRHQVGRRVVGQVLAVERRVDRDRADVADDEGVAVGIGLGVLRRAGDAARPRLVYDRDRLAEGLLHPVGGEPSGQVGGAAGGEGHDHLDRAVGIVVRRSGRSQGRAGCQQGCAGQEGGNFSRQVTHLDVSFSSLCLVSFCLFDEGLVAFPPHHRGDDDQQHRRGSQQHLASFHGLFLT